MVCSHISFWAYKICNSTPCWFTFSCIWNVDQWQSSKECTCLLKCFHASFDIQINTHKCHSKHTWTSSANFHYIKFPICTLVVNPMSIQTLIANFMLAFFLIQQCLHSVFFNSMIQWTNWNNKKWILLSQSYTLNRRDLDMIWFF